MSASRNQTKPLVGDAAPTAEVTVQRPSPIGDGQWIDEGGRLWRIRGAAGQAAVKRVQHLLGSPAVRVVLVSASDWNFTDIPASEREALWNRIHPYLKGPVDRSSGDHTDFAAGEFRDDGRQSLLFIEEHC